MAMSIHLPPPKLLAMGSVGLALMLMASSVDEGFFGHLVQIAVADGEEGQPGLEGPSRVNVVLVDHGSQKCEAAKRQAIEVTPELLALADWPLDTGAPVECLTARQEAVAAADDTPTAPVEIAEIPAVVSVMASGYGNPVHAPAAPPAGKSAPADDGHPLLGRQMAALDTPTLDEVRGGFELAGTNFKFYFGIERAVYINGELVASTVLNLKDLQLATGAGIPANSAIVVQNGTGNTAQINPNLAATVIQNTLNNQKIQNVTTINANVNSLQVMRSMAVQSAIQTGIVGSLRR